VLHYYLADDTVEIRENFPANAGRDAAAMFLRRCRLPKSVEPLRRPGEHADRTVLNVFGPMGKGGRYILDSLKVRLPARSAAIRLSVCLSVSFARWLYGMPT